MKNLVIFLFSLFIINGCKSTDSTLTVKEKNNALEISYIEYGKKLEFKTATENGRNDSLASLTGKVYGNIAIISLTSKSAPANPKNFIGTSLLEIPGFDQGIAIWRYKPWNSWTKPIRVENMEELKDWDIQFFYWMDKDGVYGAAMPLSGNGFRTTLGNHQGKLTAKSVAYAKTDELENIPQMAIAFGRNPYQLFKELYTEGLKALGKSDNLIENKTFPRQLDYIGWCTYNASNNGKDLNEEHVIEGAKTFTENEFPLGWIIIDDGWFDNTKGRLNSLYPDSVKFPNGFTSMNKRLKEECGIKEMGLWHAINGHWNGINPDSPLGKKFKDELFTWAQKPVPTDPDTVTLVEYQFIKPDSDSLLAFYRQWHTLMKNQGFTFLKVDNQLVVERMAVDNYPIFTLSEKLHDALYQSTFEHFNGAIINCMDMTADAYLNFGKSAVARTVEDYFPEHDGGVGYRMQRGNAAAHLVMAFYNSIYFQQMVYPDFDMFETYNPDAVFHAVARAINNGPVYVTDKPGLQNFDILRALCYSDGSLIRSSTSLVPTTDCLFQVQDAKPFKAFSMMNKTGLLGVWNLADSDSVSGFIKPIDVNGIEGDDFIVYEYFSQKTWELGRNESIPVDLKRMECQLYYIIPKNGNESAIGLIDKYNAPGTIVSSKIEANKLDVTVADFGLFAAVLTKQPAEVKLNGQSIPFQFKNNLLITKIPDSGIKKVYNVSIHL